MVARWLRYILFCLVNCLMITATEAASRCPRGSAACGPGCLPHGAAACIAEGCYDAAGSQILCDASSKICGGSVCPLWAFCDQAHQKCIPDTCSFRRTAWCQESEADKLIRVQCIGQAASTECFASSSGNFSCHQHNGWLVARCRDAVAVGMAAIPPQPDAQATSPGTQNSWRQLLIVTRSDKSVSSCSGSRLHSWKFFSPRCSRAQTISDRNTHHVQHRMLLQLFLPGIDSSSLSYLFSSGDASSSSYSIRYGSPSKQQPSTGSNWQQSALTATGSQLAGPQHGRPVATAKFTPVVNPVGTVQTGIIRQFQMVYTPPALTVPQSLLCSVELEIIVLQHKMALLTRTAGAC